MSESENGDSDPVKKKDSTTLLIGVGTADELNKITKEFET